MKRLLHIAFIVLPLLSFSQLVTTAMSPASAVQNVLLGPGVTVSNITYSGNAGAIGSFTAGGTNLGINSGIILTTGTISPGGNGPQGPNDQSNSGTNNNAGGYPALNNLLGGATTYNAAILEFDFVPYSDTVRFKYVFGSEEYPEFVGSNFNDVFAFFISGPGITGLQNIAKLPNGQTVSINNVNGGNPPSVPASNAAYFVNNGDGSQAPYNSSNAYIQYDGFTKVLQAVSKVECGETYHLVIAIADVGDGIYDSGIFLEANSLSSKTPFEVTTSISFDAFGDGETLAEGCVNATVNLSRDNNLNQTVTIPITVTGTAISGADFTPIPANVTFNPGQSSVNFSFSALADALPEGVETININFGIVDPCGNANPLVVEFNINDVQPVAVTVTTSNVTCPGQQVEVIANPTGGVGPYTYSWNTGATTSSIFVNPNSTQTYTVSVTDNCLMQTATGSGTVNVPVFLPLTITTSNDIVEICPYKSTDLNSLATGGAGSYVYEWTNSVGAVIGSGPDINVAPAASTFYTVTVTDLCNNVVQDQINYTITSPPLTTSTSPLQQICPFDSTTISVAANGGYGSYQYLWLHSLETTSSVNVAPQTSTFYIVRVSDECQTFYVQDTAYVEVLQPIADFQVSSNTLFNDLPITFENLTQGGQSYYWTFGDGNSSTLVHPNNTYDDYGNYIVTLIATNFLGCKDTISKPIEIFEEYWIYVPNAFTPDGNLFNNTFDISTINIKRFEIWIYNRWGEIVYSADNNRFSWDGTFKNLKCPDGTYVYKIKYETSQGLEDTLFGHVNLLR